jgi:hypothetical protein
MDDRKSSFVSSIESNNNSRRPSVSSTHRKLVAGSQDYKGKAMMSNDVGILSSTVGNLRMSPPDNLLDARISPCPPSVSSMSKKGRSFVMSSSNWTTSDNRDNSMPAKNVSINRIDEICANRNCY